VKLAVSTTGVSRCRQVAIACGSSAEVIRIRADGAGVVTLVRIKIGRRSPDRYMFYDDSIRPEVDPKPRAALASGHSAVENPGARQPRLVGVGLPRRQRRTCASRASWAALYRRQIHHQRAARLPSTRITFMPPPPEVVVPPTTPPPNAPGIGRDFPVVVAADRRRSAVGGDRRIVLDLAVMPCSPSPPLRSVSSGGRCRGPGQRSCGDVAEPAESGCRRRSRAAAFAGCGQPGAWAAGGPSPATPQRKQSPGQRSRNLVVRSRNEGLVSSVEIVPPRVKTV
jgi:hypothetical protein